MRRTLTAVTLTTLLALTACSAPALEEEPSPTTAPQENTRAEVPWQDYDASVKTRIDELTEVGDCAALQAEFDVADANDDTTRARTGHGNAELMTYIDEALRLAGCY